MVKIPNPITGRRPKYPFRTITVSEPWGPVKGWSNEQIETMRISAYTFANKYLKPKAMLKVRKVQDDKGVFTFTVYKETCK